MRLELFSEPVGPSGGASADTMGQAIASTHYDLVQTVLREALQNSCDYRTSKNSRISFSMSVFEFTNEQIDLLRVALSPALATSRALETENIFTSGDISGLLISDSGTIGLAGSTNPSVDHVPDNFTGFFFRMGRDTPTKSGGGSTGVGRAAFFSFSECATSLVYSRYKENGVIKSRFMGMALGPSFVEDGFKFTGRHWYCESVSDFSPMPIEGSAADQMAEFLGMRSDFHHETGTAILIIQPKLYYAEEGNGSDKIFDNAAMRADLAKKLRDATVLFAWPHILDGTVNFCFKADGNVFALPALNSIPCIQDFVSAYSLLLGNELPSNNQVRQIRFNESDAKVLGRLSWVETLTSQPAKEFQEDAGISTGAVALIRQAKFIVKYLPVPTRIDSASIRGVFLADDQFEADFRKSEPAAHDDWLPERLGLAPRTNNPIRQALEKIDRVFKELRMPTPEPPKGNSLVRIANRIGQLFSEDGIQGPPEIIVVPPTSRRRDGRGATSATLADVDAPRIIKSDSNYAVSEFNFRFDIDSEDQRNYLIKFKTVATLSDQPMETSVPLNAQNPKLISVSINGKLLHDENLSLGKANSGARLVVTIESPIDVAAAVIGVATVQENEAL